MPTTPLNALTDVWSVSTTAYNAVKMTVSETTTISSGNLLSLQLSAVSTGLLDKFVVNRNGNVSTGSWAASAIGTAYGGTGATSVVGAQSALGLVIGTNIQAYSAALDTFASNGSSYYLSRANHTGTQAWSTITNTPSTLSGYGVTISTASILGRSTAGTGYAEVLSVSATKSLLSLNLVENTALSTWTGTSNITALGTITTGVWNAGAITTSGDIKMSSSQFLRYNNIKMGYGQTALGNWFFGNAGNPTLTTMTGGNNVGVGDGAFFKLASNNDCVSIGVNAAGNAASGDGFVAIGRDAGFSSTSAGYFVAIGYRTLRAATTTGSGSIAIGQQAMEVATPSSGVPSVAIGYYACNALTTGYGQTAVGNAALQLNTTGLYNQAFGYQALNAIIGSNNIGIGAIAGGANTSGSNNIYIGHTAGQNQTTGSKNIIIGAGINTPSLSGSNQLNIGNLIFGTGVTGTGSTIAGLIGIACSAPSAQLEVDASTSSTIGILAKGAASQSADLLQLRNSSSVVLTNIDSAGCFTSAPNSRTATWAPYFKVTTPADTGLTASTEFIGVSFATGTRQWSTGDLATQREHVIEAPTYSFVDASTITDAATLAILAAPIAGTNATITNAYALWVQTGASKFDGNIQLNATDILTDTTTGTKIGTDTSQKFSLWNATPIIQPTTGVAAATFIANTSGIVDDSATFDGYTIGQVVKALRDFGFLA